MSYRGLLAGSALVMACATSETPFEPNVAELAGMATAQIHSVFSVEVSDMVSGQCLDEDVSISGQVTVKEFSRVDGSGGFHISSHTRSDLSGVGMSSGARYHGHGTDFISGHLKKGETFTQHSVTNLVGQGRNANLRIILRIHFTVNANGERTADTETLLEC